MPRRRKKPVHLVKRNDSPNYYYEAQINGRTVKRTTGTSDYQQACRIVEEANRRRHSGRPARTRVLFGDASAKWLEMKCRRLRNEHWRRTMRARQKRYIDPFFGHLWLDSIWKDDLREFKARMETKTRLSGRTIDHVLGQVTDFFGWVLDCDYIQEMPVPKKDFRMKLRPDKPKPLTPPEADAVCSLDGEHGLLCRVARAMGLRWGELCRLDASDISWVLGEATIRDSKGRDRVVPLGDAEEELRERFGHGYVGKLFSFSPESPGSFARVVRRRSGVGQFTVHRLRHTFGTEYLERGGSLAVLGEIMGHVDSSTTRGYARVRREALRADANRVRSATRSTTSAKEGTA